MNKPPAGSGACCLPSAKGITYIRVGPDRHIIGLQKLETVFNQLLAMSLYPDETTDEELVSMARRFNYIPNKPSIEVDYAMALRQAYTAYCFPQARE